MTSRPIGIPWSMENIAFRYRTYTNLVSWRGVFAVAKRDLLRYIQFAVEVISSPLLTFMMLAIFTIIVPEDSAGRESLLIYIASGFVAMNLMMNAYSGAAFSFLFDKLEGMWTDLFSSPLRGWEIALGHFLSMHVQSLPTVVTTVLVGSLFGLPILPLHPLMFLAALLPAIWLLTALGMIGALLSSRWDTLSAQMSFGIMPLLFLSGVFIPSEELPDWAIPFQDINPIWHIVHLVRYGIIGVAEGSILGSYAYAGSVALLATGLCMALFSRGYRLVV